MAQRRSLNRRWSRRSSNGGDLNRDSELVDEADPMWWKEMDAATTLRPSAQTSFATTTAPILTDDSMVDDSELQDSWWDNLDRTNIQSSKRFSRRRTADAIAQRSVVSDVEAESSAKKRHIETSGRTRRSGNVDNSDNSIVAQSEPLPTEKRKTRSPMKSNAEVVHEKSRIRQTRSSIGIKPGEISANTSNEMVVERRSKILASHATIISSTAHDDILANESLRKNFGKNVSRISDSSLQKSPRKSESSFVEDTREDRKKRLSTISKKLDMSEDESETDARRKKSTTDNREKSVNDVFVNPFEEIGSDNPNESLNIGKAPSKAGSTTSRISGRNKTVRTSTTMIAEENSNEISTSKSHGRKSHRTIRDETIGRDEKTSEIRHEDRRSVTGTEENMKTRSSSVRKATIVDGDATNEWTVPETQETARKSVDRTKKSATIEESMGDDESPVEGENNRRSSYALRNKSRDTTKRTREATIGEVPIANEESSVYDKKRFRSTSAIDKTARDRERSTTRKTRNDASIGKSYVEFFEESGKSDSGEDVETNEPADRVYRKSSSTKKTLDYSVTTGKLQIGEISHDRDVDESDVDTDDREMHDDERRSIKRSRKSRSFKLPDSAYELPDKERSGSLEISASDNDLIGGMNNSVASSRRSLRKDVGSERTTDKSIDRSIVDGRSGVSRKMSHQSGRTIADSKKSVSRREESSDESISEQLVIDLPQSKSNQSRKISQQSGRKIDDSKKSVSRRDDPSDVSISEQMVIDSPQSNSNRSRKVSPQSGRKIDNSKKSVTRRDDPSDVSISEQMAIDSPQSNSNRSRKMSHQSGRKIDNSKKSVSRRDDPSDVSISEQMAIDSPQSNSNQSRKMSHQSGRKIDNSKKSVSRRDDPSDESINEQLVIDSHQSNSSKSRKSSDVQRKSDHSKKFVSPEDDRYDETTDDEEEHSPKPSNSMATRKISRANDQMDSKKIATTTKKSVGNSIADENISEAETELAENEDDIQIEELHYSPASNRTDSLKKLASIENRSTNNVESGESISEEESVEQTGDRRSKTANRSTGSSRVRSKNTSRQRRTNDDENVVDNAENLQIGNSTSNKNANDSRRPLADVTTESRDPTNPNDSSIAIGEKIGESSTTIPSSSIPLAEPLEKLPVNTNSRRDKTIGNQRNITDFLTSNFLRKKNDAKTSAGTTSTNDEKLKLMRMEVEKKRREMVVASMAEMAEKKMAERRTEKSVKSKIIRAKTNATTKKSPKVVDKAFIVNGKIYKRPKLPRPKPWATDRLYRHLWKQMESKYGLRTRVKSERFVVQLAEVVALTVRRKKYEGYKDEVDAIMREMARLGIINTRNDFYHFCYDYLPYDFRVKVTPMLHPGNVRIVPYDPSTLHTPILSES